MTKKVAAPSGIPPVVMAIGAHAKIQTLTLIRGECRLLDPREGDVVENMKITMKGGGRKHDSLARLICNFGIVVEPVAKGREDKPIALIECEYGLQYDLDDAALIAKLTDRDVELFAAYNASVNAWPHAREFVQSMAQRMVLPPIVLPLFRPSDLLPPPEKWQRLTEG